MEKSNIDDRHNKNLWILRFELINYPPYSSDLQRFFSCSLDSKLGPEDIDIHQIQMKTLTSTSTNDSQTISECPKWLQFSKVSCKTCTIVSEFIKISNAIFLLRFKLFKWLLYNITITEKYFFLPFLVKNDNTHNLYKNTYSLWLLCKILL